MCSADHGAHTLSSVTYKTSTLRPAALTAMECEDPPARQTVIEKPISAPLVPPNRTKAADDPPQQTVSRKESSPPSMLPSEMQNRVMTRLNVSRVLQESTNQQQSNPDLVKVGPRPRAQLLFNRTPAQQTSFPEASKGTQFFFTPKAVRWKLFFLMNLSSCILFALPITKASLLLTALCAYLERVLLRSCNHNMSPGLNANWA
ncbi:unnamed protein product [Dibothriocephalus latus]|uniref:Uncharacterized protein n=1 Tax=Dibothriocephalus latus TaxID=60516 RepID=A0A3P7NUA7_DIBLA|nr:unnamed protein product [Dibothriocephalus latus]